MNHILCINNYVSRKSYVIICRTDDQGTKVSIVAHKNLLRRLIYLKIDKTQIDEWLYLLSLEITNEHH